MELRSEKKMKSAASFGNQQTMEIEYNGGFWLSRYPKSTVQPPKWSRLRNDPQAWNDPQIDPEMIPTFLVDPEMIPKELGKSN